jgi:hypothetical protein
MVVDRLRRPWFVELQRQGLPDAPRVWRVRGWRRSGRLMEKIAAAVREGRIDSEQRRSCSAAAVRLQAAAAATEEEQDEQDDDDDQQQRGQSHGASSVSRPPTRAQRVLTYAVEAVAANR